MLTLFADETCEVNTAGRVVSRGHERRRGRGGRGHGHRHGQRQERGDIPGAGDRADRWTQDTIRALMHIEPEDTNHFCTLNISFFAKELQEYFLRFYFWVNMFIVLSCVSVI